MARTAMLTLLLCACLAQGAVYTVSSYTYTGGTLAGPNTAAEAASPHVLTDGYVTTQAQIDAAAGDPYGYYVNGGQLDGVIYGGDPHPGVQFDLGTARSLAGLRIHYVVHLPNGVGAPATVDISVDGSGAASFGGFDTSANVNTYGDARYVLLDLTGHTGRLVQMDFLCPSEWVSLDEVIFYDTTEPVTINEQPRSQCVILGDDAKFRVIADGAAEYQWYNSVNGPMTGQTAQELVFPAVTTADTIPDYWCVVTTPGDPVGMTSNVVRISLRSANDYANAYYDWIPEPEGIIGDGPTVLTDGFKGAVWPDDYNVGQFHYANYTGSGVTADGPFTFFFDLCAVRNLGEITINCVDKCNWYCVHPASITISTSDVDCPFRDQTGGADWTEIGAYTVGWDGACDGFSNLTIDLTGHAARWIRAHHVPQDPSVCEWSMMVEYTFKNPDVVAIDKDPRNVICYPGQTVSYTVQCSGTPPFHYDWLKNGVSLGAADAPILTLTDVDAVDAAGVYSCKVTSDLDPVGATSAAATLTLMAQSTYSERILACDPYMYYPFDEPAGQQAAEVVTNNPDCYLNCQGSALRTAHANMGTASDTSSLAWWRADNLPMGVLEGAFALEFMFKFHAIPAAAPASYIFHCPLDHPSVGLDTDTDPQHPQLWQLDNSWYLNDPRLAHPDPDMLNWVHLTYVWYGDDHPNGGIDIYVNGVERGATGGWFWDTFTLDDYLMVGGCHYNTSLEGFIDEVAIYDLGPGVWDLADEAELIAKGQAIASHAVLTGPAYIAADPQDTTVSGIGDAATFRCVAAGAEPITYQWKKNAVVLPGQTSSLLTVTPTQGTGTGGTPDEYTCLVSNAAGSQESAPAKLWVPCAYDITGDLNDDCTVDLIDQASFSSQWLDFSPPTIEPNYFESRGYTLLCDRPMVITGLSATSAYADYDIQQAKDVGFNMFFSGTGAWVPLWEAERGFNNAIDANMPWMFWKGWTCVDFSEVDAYADWPLLEVIYVIDEPPTYPDPNFLKAVSVIQYIKENYPDKLAMVNVGPYANAPIHVATYDQFVTDVVQIMKPDIMSVDVYPLFPDDQTVESKHWDALMVTRNKSLQAGIPYWHWINSIVWPPDWPDAMRAPSESDLRYTIFQPAAFGYTGLQYWTYDTVGPPEFPPAMINRIGNEPTYIYWLAQEINVELAHLGEVLLHLVSTAVFHAGPDNPNPAVAEAIDFTSYGNLVAFDDNDSNWTLGFFRDIRGEQYFMVVNNEHHQDATALECTKNCVLTFDPSVTALQKIDRVAGGGVPVSLAPDHTLNLTLPGGTGDLFKYDTGKPFIEPPCGSASAQSSPLSEPYASSTLSQARLAGASPCQDDLPADLDDNCIVNLQDFAALASHWLQDSSLLE